MASFTTYLFARNFQICIFSPDIIPNSVALVQSKSPVWLLVTSWIAAYQTSLSIANSKSLVKLMSVESVMPSNHLILCRPLLLLPSIFPSIRLFSNESVLCIRWTKYWRFSFSISPSNEHSGLISFRMDWLDLLAVQGILKSLLQHHSSKASVLLFLPSFNSVCTQWPQWISWVLIQMIKCFQMSSRSL